MDIAIVTGASSSLGLAVSRRLIQLGFRVYGLGGDYKDCSLQNVNFKPVSCDLADPAAVHAACEKIIEKEKGVYLLVNNAKYFGKQHFEEMSLAEVERILKVNLLCPLVLIRALGKSLRELQGYIIQMGAPFAESSHGGAAGAASAGGLKWMGEHLFSEYRNCGVKVCHLSPEPNRTRDARVRIKPGARPAASIDPEAVAQAIEQILQSPFGNVVTEMVIRPLRIDEPEHDPVWKVPYPEPQPIPYTVPREFIDAEEQLEEEEWKQQQLRKRKRRSAKKTTATKPVEEKEAKEKPEPREKEEPQKDKDVPETPSNAQDKQRRRPRRKPKPPKVAVGFLDKGAAAGESKPVATQADPPADKKPAGAAKKGARKRTKSSRTDPARKPAQQAAAGDEQKQGARKPVREQSPKKEVGGAAKKTARKTVRKRVAKKAARQTGKDEKTS